MPGQSEAAETPQAQYRRFVTELIDAAAQAVVEGRRAAARSAAPRQPESGG